jgi:hypothetical protein
MELGLALPPWDEEREEREEALSLQYDEQEVEITEREERKW